MRSQRLLQLLTLLGLLELLLPGRPASALDPSRTVWQYKHTRWTVDDGAPGNVRAIAQTPDGYLWLGTSTGLYRFDGVSFESIPTIGAEKTISQMATSANGDLWIGFLYGRIVQIHLGTQIDRTPQRGARNLAGIVPDTDGGIWLASVTPRNRTDDFSIQHFEGDHWITYGHRDGIVDGPPVYRVSAGRDGSFYALSHEFLYFLGRGQKTFTVLATQADWFTAMAQDSASRVWLSDNQRGTRMVAVGGVAANVSGAAIPPGAPGKLDRRAVFDRDGNFWGTIKKGGVFRIAPHAYRALGEQPGHSREALFSTADGLSSDDADAILEDREGDIWIGTSTGLDRFRPANVITETNIPLNSPVSYLLLNGQDGMIYIADGDTLFRVAPDSNPVAVLRNIDNPEALCQSPDGTIWLGAHNSMFVIPARGPARSIPHPPTANYMGCAIDGHGRAWFLSFSGDFYRRDQNGWTGITTHREGSSQVPLLFAFDRQKRLLTEISNRGVVRIDFPHSHLLWPSRQIPGEILTGLYSIPSKMLIASASGLARVKGDRVEVLSRSYPWLQHVTGVAENAQGETWLQSSLGIFRLRTSDLDAAFAGSSKPLRPQLYDSGDGLLAPNIPGLGLNTAARGGDGRIWFITSDGMVWIDPAHLHRNSLPPPVVISRAIIDNRTVATSSDLVLPKGAGGIEIDYTAPSLQKLEGVRFRYRLSGIDNDWVDPGSRRQAFYSHLAPGTYQFTVIAANADGVWNKTGATLKLELPPTFAQSVWFTILCWLGIAGLLWAAYAIRVRHMARRLHSRLADRLAERERIARDLHDTLLQGFQGMVLRFQSVANRIPSNQEVRPLLDRALDRAEASLVESRNRVRRLRLSTEGGDLLLALAEVADEIATECNGEFQIIVEGSPEKVHPLVIEELSEIAREAVRNALAHARASSIVVLVVFTRDMLRLSIQDDGAGFAEEIAQEKQREGHYGLVGMRERAQHAGAKFVVRTRPGAGTEIVVSVVARLAYDCLSRQVRILRALGLRIEPLPI